MSPSSVASSHRPSLRAMLIGIAMATASLAAPALAVTPADPNATTGVKNVLNFIKMCESNGVIISGQQVGTPWNLTDLSDKTSGESEIKHIYDVTGKYPAMISLDFQNCSAYADRATATINLAKSYWSQGGLISICWHEACPRSYNSDPDVSTNNTQADLTDAEWNDLLTNTNSTIHKNYKHHLDQAYGWLKQLSDAGIVVIYRPLHEADGNWFWWGGNSDRFKALWKIQYNYLVGTKGLHNLIWVTSFGTESAYYPGSGYVDVAGRDIYSSSRTSTTYGTSYTGIKAYCGDKPAALTECGYLPTPATLHDTPNYTWFCIWTNRWLDQDYYGAPSENGPGNNPTILREIYNDHRTLERGRAYFGGNALSNGTYKITAKHSNLALEVDAWGTANGSQVQQYAYNMQSSQKWTITALGGGSQYKIMGVQSQKYLDVNGYSASDGGKVQIWSWANGYNQKWVIAPASSGYHSIRAVHSGKCVDVAGGSTANGADVHQWTYYGSNNQQWKFAAP